MHTPSNKIGLYCDTHIFTAKESFVIRRTGIGLNAGRF